MLGLSARPKVDLDVKAKRLEVADSYLNSVLYGSLDPMAKHYPQKPKPAVAAACPKPQPRQAALPRPVLAPKTEKDLAERGWKVKGTVEKGVTVSRIAGKAWNSPETYYSCRGKVVSGKDVDPVRVQSGTKVWMKK